MARRTSLLDLCVIRNGGNLRAIPKAARVALFVSMWAWATADLGRPIILADYLRFWPDEDETKVYRWQREFRELFPEYRTPRELAGPLAVAMADAKAPADLLTAQVAL